MKLVHDTSNVAHLWANQTQDSARNSGNNFYFNGKTIYSYGSHFPIAKHVVNTAGEKAALFTERKYSNTTAKQVSIVRYAANHLNLIYCYNPNYTHADNFNAWLKEVEFVAANLLKAKKPEKYLNELAYIADKVKKYADFFALPIPEKLQIALSIGNKEDFAQYEGKKKAIELQEEKKAAKVLKARHKKELAKWIKGESYRLYTHDGQDYLRVNKEENRIETTQGVKIPMETGKRIYNSIVNNTLKIGDKVMEFEVNKIGKEIKIGCHNFKTSYLLQFGKAL